MQKNREKVRLYNALYILVILLIGVLCIIAANLNPSEAEEEYKEAVDAELEQVTSGMTVYVTGEVENPGLYVVEYNTRVQKIIEIAGGATENADLQGVNLAKIPKDGDQIKVPALKKNEKVNTNNPSKAQNFETKVDINCGSVAGYMKINGMTEEIAENIVKHISSIGSFQTVEEMQFVTGMTPDVYAKIVNYYK